MEKSCQRCGTKFTAYHKKRQRYCSPKCQRQDWRGTKRRWVRLPDAIQCEWCKKEFRPRLRTTRFCSRPCLFTYLSSPKGPAWKGGRVQNPNGYMAVYAPDHPTVQNRRNGHKYVLEHRVVMEKHLGRFLEQYESVHHINGKRDDNRLENLQLRKGKHGHGVALRCADCGSRNIVTDKL